jgi:O-antigen/teichoic acid export membrane protein
MRVLFASFSKIQHEPVRMAKGYVRALSVTLIIAMLVSAFIVVNAELIVRVLLGPRWLPTIALIQILFAAFAARTGYIVAEAVPLAFGLGGQSALRQGAHVVLVVLGASIGARYGVKWATVGVATAYWIFYFLCLLLVQQLLPIKWSELGRLHLNALVVALPASAMALATRSLLPPLNLWLEFIPAMVFGIVAVVTLAVAPAKVVGEDVVRARAQVWMRLSPHLLGA